MVRLADRHVLMTHSRSTGSVPLVQLVIPIACSRGQLQVAPKTEGYSNMVLQSVVKNTLKHKHHYGSGGNPVYKAAVQS